MSPARRQRSRTNPLLLILLVLLVVVGAFGTLYARGDVKAEWLDGLLGRRKVVAAETVGVIVTARPMRPGQAVTRADVWDQKNQRANVRPISKAEVARNQEGENPWILRLSDLEGRVLARPKEADKAFTARDFLPVGTRPGPQSLVPEGKRYLVVSEEHVQGLGDMRYGDRFDMVALRSVPEKDLVEARKALAVVGEGRIDQQLRFQIQSGALVLETPLVSAGLVVNPAAYDGDAKRGKRQVGLAVDPAEISPLLAAIERKERIHAMPRSNLAGADEQMVPTGPSVEEQLAWLLSQVHVVEKIEGDRKVIVTVPRGGGASTD